MSTLARALVAGLGLFLIALCVWAAMSGQGLFTEGRLILAYPWGTVTLVDLYIGFVFFALVILPFHRKLWVGVLWVLPLPFLGNIWTALWLVVFGPKLWSRLRAR